MAPKTGKFKNANNIKAILPATQSTLYAKPSRTIPERVAVLLWGRAAGRCQIKGCNATLYHSPLTQASVNRAEKAHIYSFSRSGPRGWGKTDGTQINDISNLMLVCQNCHTDIDAHSNADKYPAELLLRWKDQHERRIELATSIVPDQKSQVVLYGANIGEASSALIWQEANTALFPERYPVSERPIEIGMQWNYTDSSPEFWKIEESNLKQQFVTKVAPVIESGFHISLFGIAPIPLLVRLGTLFTDIPNIEVRQRRREPNPTWQWNSDTAETKFTLERPPATEESPVLVISLSSSISHNRITSVLGESVSIWELTIDEPNNDFLTSRQQLSEFRKFARYVIAEISEAHERTKPLAIFPAMPVSTAIELGRVRMPKTDMPWIIYDQNNKVGKFTKAIEIGVIK